METNEERKAEASAKEIGRSTKDGEKNISGREGQELESPKHRTGDMKGQMQEGMLFKPCTHLRSRKTKGAAQNAQQEQQPGSGSEGRVPLRTSVKLCSSFNSNGPAPIPFLS